MLVQTIKSVLKATKSSVYNSEVILDTIDPKSGKRYIFKVSKEMLTVTVTKDNFELFYNVTDIEMLKLPNFLHLQKWSEISYVKNDRKDAPLRIFEESHVNIQYEAQMFIKLFRLMKERAFFVMKLNGKFVEAWYLEGKVLYITEEDDKLIVHGTDLYALAKQDVGYKILTVDRLPAFMDYRRFIDEKRTLANKLGKEFVQKLPARTI